MKPGIILGLAALAVLPLAGCVNREAQQQAARTEELVSDPVLPVTTTQVEMRDLEEVLEITGTITTAEDAAIGAATGGRLVSVYVKDGDRVTAGQVIAQQETEQLQAAVRQAQAGVAAARSQLDQAQTDAAVGPTRSDAGVEAALAQLEQAKAGLASAEAQLEKARNGARDEERRQAEAAVDAARVARDNAKNALERAQRLEAEGAISVANLEQVQSAYAAAEAQYVSALEGLNIANSATRPEDLEAAEQGVRSAQQQVRAAEENVRVSRANQELDALYPQRVASARAALSSAQEVLTQALKALSDATIRAPFSGTVSGRPLSVGTFIGPGTVVARLVDVTGAYLEAQIPERAISQVTPGMPVEITIDALAGRTIQGSVLTINPSGSEVGRLFAVRVSLGDGAAGVKAGMFARGRIALTRSEAVPTVPLIAVVEDAGKNYVFVREGDTARQYEVQLGLQQDGVVEVSGLPAGAEIIVRGQSALSDGDSIRLDEPKAADTAPEETTQ